MCKIVCNRHRLKGPGCCVLSIRKGEAVAVPRSWDSHTLRAMCSFTFQSELFQLSAEVTSHVRNESFNSSVSVWYCNSAFCKLWGKKGFAKIVFPCIVKVHFPIDIPSLLLSRYPTSRLCSPQSNVLL